MLRTLLALALLAAVSACSTTPPGASPPGAPPSPTPAVTALPSAPPSPTPTTAPPTLPPGVALVHDGILAPGTYRFTGFQPWLQLVIDSPGWEVGHFHPDEFDLFLDGTFPSVGFARFPAVATPASSSAPAGSTPATSIDAVLAAWRSNPNIVVTDADEVTIAGLSGQAVDVSVSAPQTPLFGAGGEAFKFDPGLASRFYLLAVEGGVVEVFVVGKPGELDAAIAGTRSIVESLRVVE